MHKYNHNVFLTSVQQKGIGCAQEIYFIVQFDTLDHRSLNSHWSYLLPEHAGASKRHQTYRGTNRCQLKQPSPQNLYEVQATQST